jgi:hypothetical protein
MEPLDLGGNGKREDDLGEAVLEPKRPLDMRRSDPGRCRGGVAPAGIGKRLGGAGVKPYADGPSDRVEARARPLRVVVCVSADSAPIDCRVEFVAYEDTEPVNDVREDIAAGSLGTTRRESLGVNSEMGWLGASSANSLP